MSGISMLKSGLILSTCVAGLTLSACASSHGSNSRYGGVSDYESGGDCTVSPCGPTVGGPVVDSRYGSVGGQTVQSETVVYADCSVPNTAGCAPVAPAPVYTAPAQTYTPPPTTYSGATTTQYMGPITCPAGTKDAGDGTCMQISSSSTYSGSTSYPSTSYSSTTTSSSSYNSGPVDCPAGTKDAGDGTCMMSSGSSLSSLGSSSSSSAYSGSSAVIYDNSSATQYADCPAGSVRSSSGSCTVSSGYAPAPTYTPPTTYLPIRK
jgi:hypothetical protein